MVVSVGLAGGGEPADARRLRAVAAAGTPNARLSPSPSLGALSPPVIREGIFVCPLNSSRCPPPASTLKSRGAGRGRCSVPQAAAGQAGSGCWTLRSSSPSPAASPAPAPARAPFTTQVAQGLAGAPQRHAAPGVGPFKNRRDLRRRRAPWVTRDSEQPRRGGCALSSGCPSGPPALPCLGGCQVPLLDSPYPQIGIELPGWGRQPLPLTGSLKETSAHSKYGP